MPRFKMAVLMVFSMTLPALGYGQSAKRPFTVADDIGLTIFGTAEGYPPEIRFSPDGKYVAVLTERGRLDLNCPEESLRFYRTEDIQKFLDSPANSQPPSPVWVVTRAYKARRSIAEWRWLPDSSGVAFLERTSTGKQRVALADVRKKSLEPLTFETETVKWFQMSDRDHFVYAVADSSEWKKWKQESDKPMVVGTGHPVDLLLFPEDAENYFRPHDKHWAVVGKERFAVKHNGVLSPDGRSLVASVPVIDVPQSWETLYLPPPYNEFAGYDVRIHAGHHDPETEKPIMVVNQYVEIDLQTGAEKSLTGAPNSEAAAWFYAGGDPGWSNDGKAVLLPHTFVKSKDKPSRPCVAAVDLSSNTATCVEILKAHTGKGVEEGFHHIESSRFVDGDSRRVIVTFTDEDQTHGYTEYQRAADGSWQVTRQGKGLPESSRHSFDLVVKQGLNEPPKLIAKAKESSRVLWDPNLQLKDLALGEVSVYTWKDKGGREWEGGLYKPVGYAPGRRYPLVIQTHGFNKSEFRPSGLFTTADAAEEFASAGILVLQMATGKPGCQPGLEEAACGIDMAESAASKLVGEGLADPQNIGIIGFSRTCLQVMAMLTHGSLPLKAASITDGVMFDYLQYLTSVDIGWNAGLDEAKADMGAAPFGAGLEQWIKRSPGFNLEKVNTPLIVVGEGRDSLQFMLQPYAGLRALHKPTELVLLNTDEHVLTNPAVRMASQGGSVDWFRFWLQGYEDPDPAKAEQYKRWRGLRELQEQNDKKRTVPAN